MESILTAFGRALLRIIALEPEFVDIVGLSLYVSLTALFIAGIGGIVMAYCLTFVHIPLKRVWISILNTCMGLPPVVVGLVLYLFLSRSGPLGFLRLLYSSTAMITAQVILAFPIVAAMSISALRSVSPVLGLAARGLGATHLQASLVILKEARYGIMASLMAGLGRLMAEVGAVLIVGGNIANQTRVMTTTIALEYDKGNFELAIALGLVLLTISLLINVTLSILGKQEGTWR